MASNPSTKILLKSEYSRRFPDPLNKDDEGPLSIEHHVMLCRASYIPEGLPKKPNPREQRIDIGIYKEVASSLRNEAEPSFHLKNKGITILARRIEETDEKGSVHITFGEGDGIVDGAHTYEIILDSIRKRLCPPEQFVRVEVVTGVPPSLATDIAGGLNTAVQVDDASLAYARGDLKWLEEALKGTPYANKVAYKQNQSDKEVTSRDVISLMTLFNVDRFSDGRKHPVEAYSSKSKCLDWCLEDPQSYERLRLILPDILALHDHVHIAAREKYNQELRGHAAAMKGVFNTRKRGEHVLPFTGVRAESILHEGPLYAMLGSLRFLVESGRNGKPHTWKPGSLAGVKRIFDRVAHEMVKAAYSTSLTFGRKPNAVGKDINLWTTLYKTVGMEYLSQEGREG